jgi:hypothetical protein
MGLATVQIFGEYRDCPDHDLPRPCRDTGPPHKAGFVFLGFILRIGANRPAKVSACSRFASTRRCHCPRYRTGAGSMIKRRHGGIAEDGLPAGPISWRQLGLG